jgi:hypothetical protein
MSKIKSAKAIRRLDICFEDFTVPLSTLAEQSRFAFTAKNKRSVLFNP